MTKNAKQLLIELGTVAAKKDKVTINLRVQKDSAFTWKGVAIHPLQVLENAYQRVVHRSTRNTGSESERREAEFAELSQFFTFDDGEPTFFESVKNASSSANKSKHFENVPKLEDFYYQYVQSLPAMRDNPDMYSQFVDYSLREKANIKEAVTQLFHLYIPSQLKADVEDFFHQYYEMLSKLGDFPQEEHLASVKMNHAIGTFYLFRLLVNYEIVSSDKINDEQRASVSGTLTSLLHNDKAYMAWISEWLMEKISQIGDEIRALNPAGDKVVFFLKGGRALKYFLGKPEEGENDWDTQILINPNLPAEEWYALFAQVHDRMLGKLKEFKAEFSGLVDQHKQEFENYLNKINQTMPPVIEDEEDDDYEEEGSHTEYDDDLLRSIFHKAELIYKSIDKQIFPVVDDINKSHIASCKAELIDIGIPHRDTSAALEEWSHLNGKLLGKRLKYPGHHYYLSEYLMMIRDAFTADADVRKAPKRIQRLAELLAMDSLAPVIEEERNSIRALLPKIAAAATARGASSSRLFTVMMTQFVKAYDLKEDTNLAPLFDSTFGNLMSNIPGSVKFPEALTTAINGYSNWKPQYASVAEDVGFGHLISERMAKHFQDRAAFIAQYRKDFMSFIRGVYDGIFRYAEELEVEFAIVESYAAHLQGEYLRFNRLTDLDPIRRIDIKLYTLPENKPDIVLELLEPRIRDLLQRDGSLFGLKSGEEPSLLLYWRNEVSLGEFSYKPLVMKLSVQKVQNEKSLPQLSFIKGLPVLDLRYLTTEYRRRSAEIEEFGFRKVLNAATASVAEILSRFDP